MKAVRFRRAAGLAARQCRHRAAPLQSRSQPPPTLPFMAAGFTMIEVLIALAIIAIALAASLRAVGSLAIGERDLRERMEASWSADNAVGQLYLDRSWPALGSRSFTCSQGDVALLCTEIVSTTPNPLFRQVQVTVSKPEGGGNLAQIVTMVANETNRPL
jgi:general secretion pathway protein I